MADNTTSRETPAGAPEERGEVFSARYTITTSDPDTDVLDEVRQMVRERRSKMYQELDEEIQRKLDESLSVWDIYYRSGSVELFVIVGGTLAVIRDYDAFVKSVERLVGHLTSVIQRILGRDFAVNYTSYTPGPLMVSLKPTGGVAGNTTSSGGADHEAIQVGQRAILSESAQRNLFFYLAATNVILILLIGGLLLWLVLQG